MRSGKQRRAEIKAARLRRAAKRNQSFTAAVSPAIRPAGFAPVNIDELAPDNSYGVPEFVRHGYYQDVLFVCIDCGEPGVWTAERQKWWYETAKGGRWTIARRCRACRAKKRTLREAARRTHMEGLKLRASIQ